MTIQLDAVDLANQIALLDALRSHEKPSSHHVLSKVDRLAVRHLAAFSAGDWVLQETWLARTLVSKYSAKLGRGKPDKISEAVLSGPANSVNQVAVTQNKPNIILDGDSFFVRVSYDEKVIRAIKTIPGYSWKTPEKAWTIPVNTESAYALRKTAIEHCLTADNIANTALEMLRITTEIGHRIFELARRDFFTAITRPGAILQSKTPDVLESHFLSACQAPLDPKRQRELTLEIASLKMLMYSAGIEIISRVTGLPPTETLAGYGVVSKIVGRALMESRDAELVRTIRKLVTSIDGTNPVDNILTRKLGAADFWYFWQTQQAWRIARAVGPVPPEPPTTGLLAPRRATLVRGSIILNFPFDQDLVRAIKAIPGRVPRSEPRWHWIVPLGPASAILLAELLSEFRFDFPDEVYVAIRKIASVHTGNGTS